MRKQIALGGCLPLMAVIILADTALYAQAPYYGRFVGVVQTQWDVDGRRMKLLKTFKYIDPAGGEWTAEEGEMVDGASIPRFAWSIIGGPLEDKYRTASVLHDVACREHKRPWESVHLMFYNAMRAAGVGPTKARVMYAAVYHFGPRWVQTISVDPANLENLVKSVTASSDPASRVQVNVQQTYGCPPRIWCNAPMTYDDTTIIVVTPGAGRLTTQEFAVLQAAIEQREASGGEVSLDEIRNYRR